MIRILASDIDNTLFSHQTYSIPAVNLAAADRLREQGLNSCWPQREFMPEFGNWKLSCR